MLKNKTNEVATMPNKEKTEEKAQPEIKKRAGAISVTVWKNTNKNKEGVEFDNYNFNVERGYKEKDSDEWKSTNSLRLNDVPKAISLLQQAYDDIISKPKAKEDKEE